MKFNTITKSFKEVYLSSKFGFIISYILTFMQGITNVIPIIALQIFFDSLTDSNIRYNFLQIISTLVMFIGAKILYAVISNITGYSYEAFDLRVSRYANYKTNKKAYNFDTINYENPETLNLINKAYLGTRSIRTIVDSILLVLLDALPKIIVIGVYLYSASPILPLILLIIMLPVAFAQKLKEQYYTDATNETAPLNRKIDKYSEYIHNIKYYRETMTLGMQKYFYGKLDTLLKARNKITWKCFLKSNKLEILSKIFIFLGHASIILILFFCVKNKAITIGVFAAILTQLDNLFGMIEAILEEFSSGLTEIIGEVQNYFNFQSEKNEKRGKTNLSEHNSIELKNVSFTYPNSEKKALDNISLKINKGEHIAIVGANGSGKSTIVKILSGLYTPTDGIILYNDKDALEYPKTEIYNNMSAVFQDFGRYAMTIEENVKLGDSENNDDITEFLKDAEFDAYEDTKTLLSREFNGVDLSGGQWQRLSIARGMYRKSDLLFFDEPTSAIDPKEEMKILGKIEKLISDKTSVIVTHRLSAVKLADKIVVMDKGKIVGLGTHSELLSNNDYYQTLWNSQAKLYAK